MHSDPKVLEGFSCFSFFSVLELLFTKDAIIVIIFTISQFLLQIHASSESIRHFLKNKYCPQTFEQ